MEWVSISAKKSLPAAKAAWVDRLYPVCHAELAKQLIAPK
jgi:hypothetical protein